MASTSARRPLRTGPGDFRQYLLNFHRERSFGKFWHHTIFREEAEVTALFSAALIFRFFFGKFLEISTLYDLIVNSFSFRLCFEKNMACMHLFFATHLRDFFIVCGFEFVIRNAGFHLILNKALHHNLLAGGFNFFLHVWAVSSFVFFCLNIE